MTIDTYSTYHIPVLQKEVASYLITDPAGIYVDGTVGGGGHAEYILKNFKEIDRYVAMDQDQHALQFSISRLLPFGRRISFHHCKFSEFDHVLAELGVTAVNGIFLDLGVASAQIEQPERGFSYMQSCPLDMRMNQQNKLTAADIVNNWTEQDLMRIFREYGEEHKARQIARQIVRHRQTTGPVITSEQLKKIIDRVSARQQVIKSYARIFQALRIAVNDELHQLELFLQKSLNFLKSGGRLVIIAYHSLEDRLVKNFFVAQMRPCICPPEFPVCVCGKKASLKIITKKPVRADQQEIAANIRARSAHLRAGEKL
jgi:16S rRNA (cytosine1402-N4)-methyltransferase